MEIKDFNHIQTAHCENGVITSLLNYHGIEKMTEPLAFGIGSGIFYIHLPFVKVQGGPAIAFRSMPGSIFARTCKSLKVDMNRKKFRNEDEGIRYLDEKIASGVPVGCQVGVFHLDYFPKEYRFHFNAHNLIVYGKTEEEYLISDPVMETVTSLSLDQMKRARFAKGFLAPKGQVYFPSNVGKLDDELIRKGIQRGIRKTTQDMLKIPSRIAGVKGIKHTARKVRKLREKSGMKGAALYLGQIIRMQEEIGTGGGGFRFLYAAFLEQSTAYIQNDQLLSVSEKMTQAGDLWRDSAIRMAGIYKGRLTEQKDFDEVADLMYEIAELEKTAFQQLRKLNLSK